MEPKDLTSKEVNVQISLYYRLIKRSCDIVISLTSLILLFPLMLLLCLTIYFIDGRPVFFTQVRAGLNHKPFIIWKFRTMLHNENSDISEQNYYFKDGIPENFIFKSGKNPRVTRLGFYLRKYSLDELPQFINVLIGTMSIVGPRPEILEITRFYNKDQSQRLSVKPGITGYAQINGRSGINHSEKIKYDLYYVKNKSMILDIRIILKTIFQVLLGRDAY